MKILVFAASLRTDSCNKKNAREAARLLKEAGHEAEFIDLKEYPMPPYDGDIEASTGIPQTTANLSKKISAAEAIVISTPEYNGSIPGTFKNIIDWVSRLKPIAFEGKHVLLLAASPGALGGVRSLWHSRQPLEVIGAHVFSNMLGLSDAYNAFDESGKLKDEKNLQRLKSLLEQFTKHVKK